MFRFAQIRLLTPVASALIAVALVTAVPTNAPVDSRAAAPTGLAVKATTASSQTSAEASAVSTIGVLASDSGRCTATVVASDSGSLISTAAHCVYLNGRWDLDNLRFYPGYHDGQTPYGVWQVEAAWVPQAWQQGDGRLGDRGGSPQHDFAFARLRPNADGQTAASVLGAEGIRFDAAPGTTVTELGYPATGGYNGESLHRCRAETKSAASAAGLTWTTDCDLTQGASGGPWLTGGPAGTGSGQVAGVLSMVGDQGGTSGVPFDAEAERLYVTADRGGAS